MVDGEELGSGSMIPVLALKTTLVSDDAFFISEPSVHPLIQSNHHVSSSLFFFFFLFSSFFAVDRKG